MFIKLESLGFGFTSKPLLIAGKAMEFYGLRVSGDDIDLMVTAVDFEQLVQQYPDNLVTAGRDNGIRIDEFELWHSCFGFDYQFWAQGAIDQGDYLVMSLEKLLVLKALGMDNPKWHRDLELIVEHILQSS